MAGPTALVLVGLTPSAGLHTTLVVDDRTKPLASSDSFPTHDAFVAGGMTVED